MGADWYEPIAVYGYQVTGKLTDAKLDKIKEQLASTGFRVHSLLPSFHSRMEYASSEELAEFNDRICIVIGFICSGKDYQQLTESLAGLTACVNKLSVKVNDKHGIFVGIEWERVESDD